MESVLTHLVSQGLWRSVGKVLEKGVSSTQHRWAVEQASKHCDDLSFLYCILPHCSEKDLDSVLTHLVSQGLWQSVGKVLERGVSSTQHMWAVKQASTHAWDHMFATYILPQCYVAELDSVLTQLVSQGLWQSVDKVLERGVSSTQHSWVVEQALKRADEMKFSYYILHHVRDEDLERVSTHMVSRGWWEPQDNMTVSDVSRARYILTQLMSQNNWGAVGRFLQRDISSAVRDWAIEQASRHIDDINFMTYILPHCSDDVPDSVLPQLVSRGLWESVGKVLERGVSSTQHSWAVEQASIQAWDHAFAERILPRCSDEELESVLTHLVSGGKWQSVGNALDRGVSSTQHSWAVEQASKHAWDHMFAECILPRCSDEELESVLTYLVSRCMWKSVCNALERDLSSTQHSWAVAEVLKHGDGREFTYYILPHCTEKELGQVLLHMVSQGLWKPVDNDVSVTQHIITQLVSSGLWYAVEGILHQDINSAIHSWVVEQASRQAGEGNFVTYILPHCFHEELEAVLRHLVSRGMWESVAKVLKRGVIPTLHRWAVIQASMQASCYEFAVHILPHCYDEELESVLTHLVSRGLWELVGKVLERGVSSTQHRWAVEQASRHADEGEFTYHILPHCTKEELVQALTHMVSRGLWKAVDIVTDSDVSVTQHVFSQLMSHGQWKAVDMFLQRYTSSAVRKWAVLLATRHADDFQFVYYILPHLPDVELDSVLTHLVPRGLWSSVDKVLERGVSATQHSWAVTEALKHADEGDFNYYILPHCRKHDLEEVLTHMVSRGLWEPVVNNDISVTQHVLSQLISKDHWEAVHRFLLPGVSSAVYRWAVEQASRHADDLFLQYYILPHCSDEVLESVLTHLVSRGMWGSVDKVLERGVSSAHHRSALVEAAKHIDDSSYSYNLLHHCSDDDVVAVFPHLVANKKWRCTQHVLCIMARDTQHAWMTSEHDCGTHETLFWKFIHNCRVEVSLAFGLTKAVTQQITYVEYQYWNHCFDFSSALVCRAARQESLCELLVTTLLHILCDMICSDDSKYMDRTDHTKQCVSDIYTHITACLKDNNHCLQKRTLTTIKNKQKWISVFTELADSHSNDPLFLLHFLQGVSLYYINRRGKKDDYILLVMLAVFPTFPQLQSVALGIMLRKKRWDILSQACLSHVWEHDRRRLFKAAVMQGQWDVVQQWCDHTVHDDQRHWTLTEAFKEKEWEVYLLLVDHGLTVDEQMYAHYRVAKYGHWATVLNMVDRGGDITEVSNLLEKWVMRYLRKKPEGDVTVYEQRCMKLIRLRLRFARKSVLSPRKALERCLWGSVLFNILHKPTKRFFSEVLDKVLNEQQWHVLMHLVRLGTTSADRDRLFPDMVRQQQWDVCRQLLEHGVDDQLCLGALPDLMEKNQWILVARVMEHDVDDAVRRQVLLWAFQRRAGALFWHCLNLMGGRAHLSTGRKNTLFHHAISREIWQAVKPLVKEKDGPDIQRRDLAFLEAIEHHLWDVVDYCQRLGVDINMKDDNGETPLNREARKREWKAVEEIVLRDGYPNHLDKDAVSVLNRLIDHKQWDIVKVVIKYGGDIHLSARYSEYRPETHTPLQALITARQADVIHYTIKWCGGQDWGVNDKGERVMHAVCDSDMWDVMRDLIDIKVNPLVLTNTGKSPLAYAVLNTKCGQRMVAECSRQGFSFHQPSLTGPQESLLQDVRNAVVGLSESDELCFDYIRWYSNITSPLVCAVICHLPVVAFMLYESGSCSNTELFTLYTQLPKLADMNTKDGRALQLNVRRKVENRLVDGSLFDRYIATRLLQDYNWLSNTLLQYAPFLRELATTARPLLSSCRLKILQSQCFHFSNKYREEEMDDLPVPEVMKKYLKFSDFCDPDYGGHMK